MLNLKIFLAVAAAAVIFSGAAHAAAYMKIGDIKGETQNAADRGHQDEIEVLSWSWGAANATAKPKRGPGVLKVSMKSGGQSERLQRAHESRARISSLTLTVDQDGTAYTYKLKNAFITSYEIGRSVGAAPMEEIAFNYAEIEW